MYIHTYNFWDIKAHWLAKKHTSLDFCMYVCGPLKSNGNMLQQVYTSALLYCLLTQDNAKYRAYAYLFACLVYILKSKLYWAQLYWFSVNCCNTSLHKNNCFTTSKTPEEINTDIKSTTVQTKCFIFISLAHLKGWVSIKRRLEVIQRKIWKQKKYLNQWKKSNFFIYILVVYV